MKRLRFLQIPKTAGTTFNHILFRQYYGKPSFSFSGDPAADIARYEAISDRDKQNIALFIGHAPIVTGVIDADNAMTITFLRDPISRVKSFCQHVAEGKSPYLIHDFPTETFDLDQFLESGNQELSNLQTKMLINKNVGGFSNSLIDNMSGEQARETALDNLYNKISHFGIQEFFDESLILLGSALNWKMPYYFERNKKNTKKQIRFEERHIEKIASLNSIDIAVYQQAKARFLELLDSEGFDNEKLEKLRFINGILRNPVLQFGGRVIGLTDRYARRLFRATPLRL